MPDVSTESPAFKAAMKKWALPMVLDEGTDAIRAEARTWLPRFEGETIDDHDRRVANTTVTNVFKKTISKLSSTPFTEPITFDPDLDDRLGGEDGAGGWIRNIDRAGADITTFAKDCLADLLKFGKCHIYVDYPRVDRTISQAEAKALEVRPFFKRVCPGSLFFWEVGVSSGTEVIEELRWREMVCEKRGEWEQIEIEQIRRVRRGQVELWRRNNDPNSTETWKLHDRFLSIMPGDNQRIPFVTIYANRQAPLVSNPPLDDLAQLNLKHCRSDSDLQRIIHLACTPFMLAKGFTQEELNDLELSAKAMITTVVPEADIKYIEHSGSQIAALQANLEVIMSDMEAMSLQMISRNAAPAVTASEKIITTAEQTSELQEIVRNLESGITKALQVALMWVGEKDPEDVVIGTQINNDFGLVFRVDNDLTNLAQMFTSNAITHETYLKEAKARGLLDEAIDVVAEVKAAKKEAADSAAAFSGGFENHEPKKPDEPAEGSEDGE